MKPLVYSSFHRNVTQQAFFHSLDDFIETRLGHPHDSMLQSNPPSGNAAELRTRSDRIQAFRTSQKQSKEERDRRREERLRGVRTAVHLLSAEEVKHLFSDVATGLAFLVRGFEFVFEDEDDLLDVAFRTSSMTNLSYIWT